MIKPRRNEWNKWRECEKQNVHTKFCSGILNGNPFKRLWKRLDDKFKIRLQNVERQYEYVDCLHPAEYSGWLLLRQENQK